MKYYLKSGVFFLSHGGYQTTWSLFQVPTYSKNEASLAWRVRHKGLCFLFRRFLTSVIGLLPLQSARHHLLLIPWEIPFVYFHLPVVALFRILEAVKPGIPTSTWTPKFHQFCPQGFKKNHSLANFTSC